MTLEQFYYISQVLSTFALIASVLYLGRQTHLAAKSQQAQMHQARTELLYEYFQKLTDPELGPLMRAASLSGENLDEDQLYRAFYYASSVLRFFDESYLQWRDGLIARERWESTIKLMSALMTQAFFRATFQIIRGRLNPEFVATIDEVIAIAVRHPSFDAVAELRKAIEEDRVFKEAVAREA